MFRTTAEIMSLHCKQMVIEINQFELGPTPVQHNPHETFTFMDLILLWKLCFTHPTYPLSHPRDHIIPKLSSNPQTEGGAQQSPRNHLSGIHLVCPLSPSLDDRLQVVGQLLLPLLLHLATQQNHIEHRNIY